MVRGFGILFSGMVLMFVGGIVPLLGLPVMLVGFCIMFWGAGILAIRFWKTVFKGTAAAGRGAAKVTGISKTGTGKL